MRSFILALAGVLGVVAGPAVAGQPVVLPPVDGVPVEAVPMPVPVPEMVVPAPAPAIVPMTLDEACCTLKELKPGTYTILFQHPITCCPIEVCIDLPCGCYELECGKGLFGAKRLKFKYPGLCNDVVVKFKKDGTAVVKS